MKEVDLPYHINSIGNAMHFFDALLSYHICNFFSCSSDEKGLYFGEEVFGKSVRNKNDEMTHLSINTMTSSKIVSVT